MKLHEDKEYFKDILNSSNLILFKIVYAIV